MPLVQRRAALVFFVVTLIGAAIVFGVQARGSNVAPAGAAQARQPGARADPGRRIRRRRAVDVVDDHHHRAARTGGRSAARLVKTVTGAISPKSVVATGTGLVFAQNMMYRHTMTVYDARRHAREDDPRQRRPRAASATRATPACRSGAPVEGAVSPDHRYFYATNYSMYGADFGPEGSDNCGGPGGLSPELRVPGRPEDAGDHRRRAGRHGPEVRRGHARRPLRPRHQLVLVRPQRHRPRDVQGGQAHPARHRPAGIAVDPASSTSRTSR